MAATDEPLLPAGTALNAILALLVHDREERNKGASDAAKIEIILNRAGLSQAQIAAVTGKTANAVQKTLKRQEKAK